jgi:predicted alpha-1,6-mannanase (GH76 family)
MQPEPEQYRAWADGAVSALQRWYNPRTGLWKTAGWWNCANALTAVIQHSQRTGERRYRYVIETTFGQAQRVSLGFSNEYYDDDGWWALAWIAAFDLTGEMKYLDLSRKLFAGMAAGWDDVCGGGLWWTRERRYKNAIPNELFLLIAAATLRDLTVPPGIIAEPGEWLWGSKTGHRRLTCGFSCGSGPVTGRIASL